MILTRESVASNYRALALNRLGAGHPAVPWVDRLPPYLCRSLILGTGVKDAARSLCAAYVGTADGRLLEVSGLQMSAGPFGDLLFAKLPLGGHVPLDVPGLADWLQLAMATLGTVHPEAAEFVRDWCSLIVWVAPDANCPPKDVLTSVAIPTLPHCTFLSVKSLRHIPAQHVYDGASLYALGENLYHEALHQQLSAALIFTNHAETRGSRYEVRHVVIPWRGGAKWKVDRVVHAAWVYSNLQHLRRRALSLDSVLGPDRIVVQDAVDESADKLEFLLAALQSEQLVAPAPLRLVVDQLLKQEAQHPHAPDRLQRASPASAGR